MKHTVNINNRTSNCQSSLFSKKNPIIRIFYISGSLAVPINPDKWRSAVFLLPSSSGLLVIFTHTNA